MSARMAYHQLFTKVVSANMVYHEQYETSPTITELSEIIGATEEHILESMEFGRPQHQILC